MGLSYSALCSGVGWGQATTAGAGSRAGGMLTQAPLRLLCPCSNRQTGWARWRVHSGVSRFGSPGSFVYMFPKCGVLAVMQREIHQVGRSHRCAHCLLYFYKRGGCVGAAGLAAFSTQVSYPGSRFRISRCAATALRQLCHNFASLLLVEP